jgi:hypothetical protein
MPRRVNGVWVVDHLAQPGRGTPPAPTRGRPAQPAHSSASDRQLARHPQRRSRRSRAARGGGARRVAARVGLRPRSRVRGSPAVSSVPPRRRRDEAQSRGALRPLRGAAPARARASGAVPPAPSLAPRSPAGPWCRSGRRTSTAGLLPGVRPTTLRRPGWPGTDVVVPAREPLPQVAASFAAAAEPAGRGRARPGARGASTPARSEAVARGGRRGWSLTATGRPRGRRRRSATSARHRGRGRRGREGRHGR